MSLIFMDGVDDNLSSLKWTTFGDLLSTSVKRTGTTSIQQNSTNSFTYALGTDKSTTVGVGAAFNLQHNSDTILMVFRGDSGATTHMTIKRSTTGQIYIANGAGTTLATSNPGLMPTTTWCQIEVKYFMSDTVGVVQVRLNGGTTPVIDFLGDTKNAGTDANIDNILFGSQNLLNYYDDIFIWNGAGSVNNTFLGDCSIQTLYADGNGNYSAWVGSDGNSVNNYQQVDEAGASSTADYNESGTATNKDTYTFSDASAATVIKGVVHRSHAAKSDAGAQVFRQLTRISGTDYNGSDVTLSTSYAAVSQMMETSPASGVAWTQTELNATEFGVEAR